jgi:PAS domain S-box-containing protein
MDRDWQGQSFLAETSSAKIGYINMPDSAPFKALGKKARILENAARERNALQTKLADAIEIAHLGLWEYDVATDLFTFDDHFYRILRTTADEIGGHTMPSAEYARRFLPPENRHLVKQEIRKAIETPDPGLSRELEHPIVYADGAIGHIIVRYSTATDSRGRTIKIYGVNQDITDRKRIEEALRQSEGYLRALIRTLPDLVWLKDPGGVYISCNSRFERLFDAQEKDIIGKTDYDFVDRELADFFRKHDKAAIAKGAPSINEEAVTFADDGHREILETIKTPMYGNGGHLIGVLGIGRDITGRKQMQADLMRRIDFEKLVSRISSELAGAGPGDLDLSISRALAAVGRFTGADRAYVFQFKDGGSKTDNTHEWCADGISPQIEKLQDITLEDELPWFTARIRNREIFHVPDVSALPPDAGRERKHFEVQGIRSLLAIPIGTASRLNGFLGFDAVRTPRSWGEDDRNILRFLGETLGHVMGRKRTEKALRESEARWQFALEGSGDGIWDLNIATGRVYLSHNLKSMLGYGGNEIGDTIDDLNALIHPDDRDALEAKVKEHLPGGKPYFQIEYRLQCKDGSYKWILVRGKEIAHAKDGRPLRVIGTHTDISERKNQEVKHERLIRELQEALARVKQLSGLLPICSYCKKIRDDKGYWKQIELYIREHSEADFSHSICQDCMKKFHPNCLESED